MTTAAKVFTGALYRVQQGHGKQFVAEPPPEPVRRPARVAIMLALAHKIRAAIAEGQVRDQADVARRLGFTRARVTHLLDLTLLAPDLQERVLFLEAIDGVQPLCERSLRAVAHGRTWVQQRATWVALVPATGPAATSAMTAPSPRGNRLRPTSSAADR